MPRNRLLPALLALCVLLSGCASPVRGAGGYSENQFQQLLQTRRNGPTSSVLALGSADTVDYCSLIKPETIPGAKSIQPVSSFISCEWVVKLSGTVIQLSLGYLSDDHPTSSTNPVAGKRLPGGLTAEQDPKPTEGSCRRYLRFSDGRTLIIDVNNVMSGVAAGGTLPEDKLCVVAGSLVDGAATAISEQRISHRQFAWNSLGLVPACGMLSADSISAKLGTRADERRYPNQHICRWGELGEPLVTVGFGISPLPHPGPGVSMETLGGRETGVRAAPQDYSCILETTQLASPDGSGLGEVAAVVVNTQKDGKDPCIAGRALAAEAWPKLPPR